MEDNKGFTLIELLVTIVLLAIVTSIGAYSIINIMRASNQKSYALLVKQINEAAEIYYQECKYNKNTTTINCDSNMSITLNTLVEYGILTGNKKNDNGTMSLINPVTEDDIGTCRIIISYSNGKVRVANNDTNSKCIKDYTIRDYYDLDEE